MINKLLITFLIIFIGFTALAPVVLAQDATIGDDEISSNPIWGGRNPVTCHTDSVIEGDIPTGEAVGCDLCDALKVGANITDFLIQIALILVVLMTVYGGFLMMTAGGSQEKYSRGKSSITWAIIGLVIVLSSWVIVNTLIHIMAGEGVNVPWSTISC